MLGQSMHRPTTLTSPDPTGQLVQFLYRVQMFLKMHLSVVRLRWHCLKHLVQLVGSPSTHRLQFESHLRTHSVADFFR